MDESAYKQFLDRIKFEQEELREDLKGLPTHEFKRIGDFGCGWGFVTWSLAQEFPTSDCVGVDRFDFEKPPYLFEMGFSLENIQIWYKQKEIEKPISFIQGDIIIGENLPNGLDLIYCKRVMFNIFGDEKKNELSHAINHISQVLKPNGWFCLIEINEPYFKTSLEELLIQVNFEFMPPRCLYRPYRTPEKTYEKYPYLIYQCKKVKQE
ncbi:MAG: class I SAM-dependent methyltransferase [Anaerolineales bacterium]|nr:class I SAM-dependent methyltransferase [Anaerolineales bacterium]